MIAVGRSVRGIWPNRTGTNRRRLLSTAAAAAVEIKYDEYVPGGQRGGAAPVLFLHGVLGNRRNWTSAAKSISEAAGRATVRVDLRNHGDSPHVQGCSIEAMSSDVLQLAAGRGLREFGVVGHSLGGKVAMHIALEHPELVQGLVVVDIPPVPGKLSEFPEKAMDLMLEINRGGKVGSIKDLKQKIDARLQHNPILRDFILSCSTLSSANPSSNFKANIETLRANIHEIWRFPLADSSKVFEKPALFIMGARSEFRSDAHDEAIKRHFPRAEIKMLDTGHFVQAEEPQQFVNLVSGFPYISGQS